MTLQQDNWRLKKELQQYRLIQRKFNKIKRFVMGNIGTKHTDFVECIYKSKHVWSNKLSYLAGIIDGEGHIKIEKNGTLRFIVGMTDKNTINWIYNNFGGNISEQKCKSGKPFYVWRMNSGADLIQLSIFLIPFLITKKQIVIDAFDKMYNKIKSLEQTIGVFQFTKEDQCPT